MNLRLPAALLALAVAGCPPSEDVKPTVDAGHKPVDEITEASPAAPEMAQRPAFGPERGNFCVTWDGPTA